MKTAIGSLTLALALIVTPGAAQSVAYVVPPKEYDHPFGGTVIVLPARDQKQVRELCPKAKFMGAALGCPEITSSWDCRVVLAADSVIKAAGFPPALVKRHEIAHCNGWPADHRGALPFEEWATDGTPASQFDSFARIVVGKTVAEVAKGLPQNVAWLFPIAALRIGLAPQSQLTGQVLSDPATAGSLARAAGIGTDLSDEHWRQAHALAFQASKRARRKTPPLPLLAIRRGPAG
jgi:hypothetical protein